MLGEVPAGKLGADLQRLGTPLSALTAAAISRRRPGPVPYAARIARRVRVQPSPRHKRQSLPPVRRCAREVHVTQAGLAIRLLPSAAIRSFGSQGSRKLRSPPPRQTPSTLPCRPTFPIECKSSPPSRAARRFPRKIRLCNTRSLLFPLSVKTNSRATNSNTEEP